MELKTLEILACPTCRGKLTLESPPSAPIQTGSLRCDRCGLSYPVVVGIPHFLQREELTGFNRKFSRLYDWFSIFYRLFSKLAFAYIGMKEGAARREILDRLQPNGGRVLEVSVGPGVNIPYLIHRSDVGEFHGLDISIGQLTGCQRFLHRKRWNAELSLGNAEKLPYADCSFDAVFHIGGINFFNDKSAAIHEMIRVAKPGTRILISDESEKGAQGYEKFVPGFKKNFDGKRPPIMAPLELIPPEMHEVRAFDVWKGWLYCLEFRKP
jgi:ubiquinone/menaquinone biosynthesis C-methylase UbiE/uncharacterized protein YbaR (Trm112 family)